MEEDIIREQLEGALDSQDFNYSLSIDVEEDYITVGVSYEGDSFPKLGKELDNILEDDYMVEIGEIKPETDLPNTRSYTVTLKPANRD
jgi:hypothetical protein